MVSQVSRNLVQMPPFPSDLYKRSQYPRHIGQEHGEKQPAVYFMSQVGQLPGHENHGK